MGAGRELARAANAALQARRRTWACCPRPEGKTTHATEQTLLDGNSVQTGKARERIVYAAAAMETRTFNMPAAAGAYANAAAGASRAAPVSARI